MGKGDTYIDRDGIKRVVMDDTGTSQPVYEDYDDPERYKWVEGVDPDGVFVVICAVCKENNRRADDNMPYLGGKWYHGESCYPTILESCSNCQGNKLVTDKFKIPGEHKWITDLCQKCYMKKYKLGIRSISMKF